MNAYDPERYWSRVALEIAGRGPNVIAGDDNPYYRYKREKFLSRFLDAIDFDAKVVLELGCGPGGNLRHILKHRRPRQVLGVDLSQPMLDLARETLREHQSAELIKTDGSTIPCPDQIADIAFTVTVLQHNTDPAAFDRVVRELCRVVRSEIVVMEDIGAGRRVRTQGSFLARPVEVYEQAFRASGFELVSVAFLGTWASRWWHRLAYGLYRMIVARGRREGEALPQWLIRLLQTLMPMTKQLDRWIPEKRDLARLVFRRVGLPAHPPT